MRRSDREIKDFHQMIQVMERCDVCRLALNDEEVPYILPLNFGMKADGETLILYFHGAMEGKKYELIGKNPKASFEMDCSHQLVTDVAAGHCTMEYESIIGKGIVSDVAEEEKESAVKAILDHYGIVPEFKINQAVLSKTRVFQLTVLAMTGKSRMK